MIDLSTTYLGLKLRTPLVSSASPLTQELDSVRRLEDAGASAIVFHSLFEEAPQNETALVPGRPALDHYLSHFAKAKDKVTIPLIASLCGTTPSGWIEYARQLEHAGADAIELNLYQVPSQADVSGAALEDGYVEIVSAVKSAVKIPIAAKLTPFFTSMSHMAKRFDQVGVDGLCTVQSLLSARHQSRSLGDPAECSVEHCSGVAASSHMDRYSLRSD